MKSINFLFVATFIISSAVTVHAGVSPETDFLSVCNNPAYAKNHWLISFDDSESLKTQSSILKRAGIFRILKTFDHIPLPGKRVQWNGILITLNRGTPWNRMLDAEATLSQLQALSGTNVGCIVRESFDEHMHFVTL